MEEELAVPLSVPSRQKQTRLQSSLERLRSGVNLTAAHTVDVLVCVSLAFIRSVPSLVATCASDDIVMSHALEWPSLTVQWLPDRILPAGCDYSIQRLLLGTHTSDGEANFVHIAEVRLPLEETEIDARAYEKTGDPTAPPAAAAASSATPADVGGYASTYGKVEIVQSMLHTGEVHRARVMPQHSHYIATKSPHQDVFIFDRSLHPARPAKGASNATPDFRLVGHEKEGYALSWSPREAGLLLSGSEDTTICLWDLSAELKPASTVLSLTSPSLPASHTGAMKTIQATHTYRGHTEVVEDVQWNPHADGLFASCGDDKLVILWDRRQKESQIVGKFEAHSGEVNCLSYNPFTEHLLVSGSSDRSLALWDLRNTSSKLHSFESHTDQVTSVEWSPFSETIFASAAADRRVNIWDVTRIGMEQEPEDSEDGPPELLFSHGGHTDKIVDFNWNQHEQWLIASVADDNTLQVWQVAESILEEEAEEEAAAKEPAPEDLE